MLFELTQLGEVKKGVRFIHCVDCLLEQREGYLTCPLRILPGIFRAFVRTIT
jgi:hypothetical protein